MNSPPKFSLFHNHLILRFSLALDFLRLSPVYLKDRKDDIKQKGLSSECMREGREGIM